MSWCSLNIPTFPALTPFQPQRLLSAPPSDPVPPPDVSLSAPTLEPHTFPRYLFWQWIFSPVLWALLWFCSPFPRCSQTLLHLTQPSPKRTPVCLEPPCLLHALPGLACSQPIPYPLTLLKQSCIHLSWPHPRQLHTPSRTNWVPHFMSPRPGYVLVFHSLSQHPTPLCPVYPHIRTWLFCFLT